MPHDRATFDDSKPEREAFYEQMWNSPGFTKLTSNYVDILTDPDANREWCEFLAGKIRGIVHDPDTAAKLIPDHRYGQKRPPFVTGYYEAYNDPKVTLVDLAATPIERITAKGIETADGLTAVRHHRVGDRLRLRHRRAEPDGDPRPGRRWPWRSTGRTGPSTYLGIACRGFPNFFFPGGPHGATGNNPRYAGDQVDFIVDALVHMRRHGDDIIEVDPAAEEAWTAMVNRYASLGPFSEASYFFGSNIPGKPVRYLLNPGGRPKLHAAMAACAEHDYESFRFARVSDRSVD